MHFIKAFSTFGFVGKAPVVVGSPNVSFIGFFLGFGGTFIDSTMRRIGLIFKNYIKKYKKFKF